MNIMKSPNNNLKFYTAAKRGQCIQKGKENPKGEKKWKMEWLMRFLILSLSHSQGKDP